MLLAAVLLDAFHAGLEDTEEAFDGVRGDEALRDLGLETMPVTTDRGCGADSGEVGRAFRMMSATRFRSKPAINSDRCRPGGERPAGRLSFGISVSAMVGSPMMFCHRSISGHRAEVDFSGICGVTVRVAR